VRILLISELYPPSGGGLEYHVQGLAHELTRRQHDVHVATLGPSNCQRFDGVVPVHQIRSSAARLPGLHADRTRPFHPPFADPGVRRQLVRLLEQVQPEVVHAHNWMVTSLPRQAPPIVFTSHDYAWICPKRTLIRPDGSICSGPTISRCTPCGREQYGLVRSLAVDLATRYGRMMVVPTVHVAVSTAVQTALSPFTIHPPIVISNFVDPLVAYGPDVDVPGLPDEPFALFGGDALAHKGIDVLLAAWSTDPQPCPLVVASLHDTKRSWPPYVHAMSLTREQMITAWRRSTVALVPSIWSEPCPTVAIEAMAQGVPVVGSDVGGLGDIVENGVNGLLVAPGDSEALRSAVAELISDPERRKTLGEAARESAARWMLPGVASRLEALYREVLRPEANCARR